MPIFPYEEEEERRRRADIMGELDVARRPVALPEALRPTSRMSVAGDPASLPPPPINRQSRFDEVQEARDRYLERTPGRGRSALTGALQGFLGGGGLLGAITGAASGAIDPRGLREQQFNSRIRPQIEERFRFEDLDRAAVRQAGEDELNRSYRTAQIGALNRQNLPDSPKSLGYGDAPGLGIYSRDTGEVATPAKLAAPKEDLRFTNQGLIDISKTTPEQRRTLTPYQKPKAAGSGRGGGSSTKDMRAANADMRMFQRLKSEADRANWEGDTELFSAKMAELQDAADRIDALYGDVVEVGESGGWPYVKFRQEGRKQAKQAQPAKQGRSADPLGIR